MTVVNPKSISGITSITTASGSDNLLTIHTSDASNTERLRIDSTGATKIVTGIVTTLTATTGIVTTFEATTGNITTLRAPTGIVTSLEATTGDITTLRAPTGIVTTFVTNTANVGAAVTINSDGVVAAGIAVTCGSINGAPIGRKNVLINGDFNVWQRAIGSEGTSTLMNSAMAMRCDRWTGSIQYQAGRHSRQSLSGINTAAGQQGYYCLRVGSSNGTSTRISAGQYIEAINARPLAGRECTLSFYIKFSAATFSASSGSYGNFLSFSNYYTGVNAASYSTTPASSETHLGIAQGSLPTTWTRYTKTFTPPVNMQNMTVSFQFSELGQTSSDDDFYYELSNVQLELGSQATPFEHISYGENLQLCQRYYYVVADARDGSGLKQMFNIHAYSSGQFETTINYPTMRTNPSLVQVTGTGYYQAMNSAHTITFNNYNLYQAAPRVCLLFQNSNLSASPNGGQAYRAQFNNSGDGAYIHLAAEI
jgi:hypothetical protein